MTKYVFDILSDLGINISSYIVQEYWNDKEQLYTICLKRDVPLEGTLLDKIKALNNNVCGDYKILHNKDINCFLEVISSQGILLKIDSNGNTIVPMPIRQSCVFNKEHVLSLWKNGLDEVVIENCE